MPTTTPPPTPTPTTPPVLDDLLAAHTAAIANLLDIVNYEAPSISAYTVNGASSLTIEKGSTIPSAALAWALLGSAPTSQVISNVVDPVAIEARSVTVPGPIGDSTTWQLTVTDIDPKGATKTAMASVALNVRQKRYWGVSTKTALDDADILALASEFATSRVKSVTTFDCTGGRYIYYAYPATFGEPTVTVGANIVSAWTNDVQPFVNASGHEEVYNVIRLNNLYNGFVPVSFA